MRLRGKLPRVRLDLAGVRSVDGTGRVLAEIHGLAVTLCEGPVTFAADFFRRARPLTEEYEGS